MSPGSIINDNNMLKTSYWCFGVRWSWAEARVRGAGGGPGTSGFKPFIALWCLHELHLSGAQGLAMAGCRLMVRRRGGACLGRLDGVDGGPEDLVVLVGGRGRAVASTTLAATAVSRRAWASAASSSKAGGSLSSACWRCSVRAPVPKLKAKRKLRSR